MRACGAWEPSSILGHRPKNMIQKQKGTRDFYPEEKRTQNYIFEIWKSVAESFGYEEINGPTMEPIDLYKKSGSEIPEQIYTLKDKSDNEFALRPELTPTIARMISQKQGIKRPIKWYAIPDCYRYEAPQSGRLRQFAQFNLDLLGTETTTSDAEVITVLVELLKAFGFTKNDVFVRISNRKVIESFLDYLTISNKKEIAKLIDKYDKLSPEGFQEALTELIESKKAQEISSFLKIRNISDIKFDFDEKGKQGLKELNELFTKLKAFGVLEYCRLDLSIMRGFDYYTGTIFEAYDTNKKFRALAGGGRYDNLVDFLGGEPCPGIGFGMGDVILELLLQSKNKLPQLKKEIKYYIAPVNDFVLNTAIEIAQKLRKYNNVELEVTSRKLSKQFEYASEIGAEKIVIVGEKDLENKQVTIRDLENGKEEKVNIKNL